MTTANAILACRLISDKFGSPYFESADWVSFINMSQQESLKRVIPDQLGISQGVEVDSNTLENIKPLIYTLTITPASGLLTNASLDTALHTASSDTTSTVFRVLNMAINGTEAMIKYVPHNNLFAYKRNAFKEPLEAYPLYTIVAGGFQVYPSIALTVRTTVIKTPKIATNTGESLDWDDYMMNQVILNAVKLAGVPIHDEELIANTVNTGFQSGR